MRQKDRVLKYLMEYGSITSLEAFRDLGITRLSHWIYSLKKAGYMITSEREQTTNRFGDHVSYCRYRLVSQEEIETAIHGS